MVKIKSKENTELELNLFQSLFNRRPNFEKIRQEAQKEGEIALEYRLMGPDPFLAWDSSVRTIVKVSCGEYTIAWSRNFGKKETYDVEAVIEQLYTAQTYIDQVKDKLEQLDKGF